MGTVGFIAKQFAKGFVIGIVLHAVGTGVYYAGKIVGANEAYDRVAEKIDWMYENGYAVCRVSGDDESLL